MKNVNNDIITALSVAEGMNGALKSYVGTRTEIFYYNCMPFPFLPLNTHDMRCGARDLLRKDKENK